MKYHNVIIRWSKIATMLFIAMVLVGDIFGFAITRYICWIWAEVPVEDTARLLGLSVVYYLGTAGAYAILFSLLKLLFNMGKDIVFDRSNTKLMNIIAYTFVAIAVDCTVGGFIWSGSFILAILALFLALVVQSVRVVFDKAITMKEELDLTI
ncbi:MAG: DUF2975 domain-containing protein [Oscillospiraceae bacterium]|jgi:hypothetical protein|nr:DUF2975 domain-containing protein [Oscillospiraceae bacterium]